MFRSRKIKARAAALERETAGDEHVGRGGGTATAVLDRPEDDEREGVPVVPPALFPDLVQHWETLFDAPKRNRTLDKWGWYQPRATPQLTTTRQGEALNLAQFRRSENLRGLIGGVDLATRTPVIADGFALYGANLQSINSTAIGDIGVAKTSIMITNIARHLSLHRKVFNFDKKPQAGEGELSKFARDLGVNSVRFGAGGTRLNLLDPMIVASSADLGANAPSSQQTLVKAVLEDAMGRGLSETETSALNAALLAVSAERTDRNVPTVPKLAERLLDPHPDDMRMFGRWSERALDWGRDPGLALYRMCEGDLRGLVDGETTDDVTEALEHPFVHFDVSGLPEGGPAIRVVMTVLNTLVSNIALERSRKRLQTVQDIQEAWHVADGTTGALVRRNLKLSRGLALATQTTFHRPSDFPEGSAAQSIMKENGIIFCYRQGRAKDAREVCEMFDFPPGTIDILMNLPRGVCLAKIGTAAPVVMEHVRSPQEVVWTDTDEVITGRSVTGELWSAAERMDAEAHA